MTKRLPTYPRILSIAPTTRGFGFVILEGLDTLADWGVKSVEGDKNTKSLTKVGALIAHYQPEVVVLENTETKNSRRSARIRSLNRQIVVLARSRKLRVALFSQDETRPAFFADGQGTRHALAEIIAERFPEELGTRLPPNRRPWMSEDYRMGIFDAVALAWALRLKKSKRTA
ncbi:MAG: hypothetical protein EPO07_06920 [Verrucomicrobia bacterium]|nr:MAG: hypothetical protein EPO07_06920 [Verrucomicrobiota bacterium]